MIIALGCADASLAGPASKEPFLYLILSSEPLSRGFSPFPDTALQALLLTTGSASGAPFRSANCFELTAETGGSPFVFVSRATSGPAPGVARSGAIVEDGNFVLPFTSTPTARGASELQPFGIYDLHLESEGRTITGRVIMPARPQPAVLEEGGLRFITFPKAAGAAAY